jgi:putative hemolysin
VDLLESMALQPGCVRDARFDADVRTMARPARRPSAMRIGDAPPGPFTLPRVAASPAAVLLEPFRLAAERVLGLFALNRLYAQASARPETHVVDRMLGALEVSIEPRGDLRPLRDSGPLIVVANHPLGALDGLVLASLVTRERNDVRLLANHLLMRIPALRPLLIPVDPFGGGAAVAGNRQPLRDAVRWLRQGGSLCVFPSGAVSHFDLKRLAISDPQWSDAVGRLVRLTGARVVPFFIEGRNGAAFQIAGLVHPALRTLLLPRVLVGQRGSRVVVHVGEPAPRRVAPRAARETTAALRAATEALPTRRQGTFDARAPLASEVASIIARDTLLRSDAFAVFTTTADGAPRLLEAIGRARERTFRAVGEGTGGDIDLDDFDSRYLHLCVWDERARCLAGAYRMQPVDVAARAPLYTQTLFHYDHRFVRAVAPGLELGRAFVTREYQKHYAPLMLLWSGIGRYVARHAHVRHLFGAVSLSATYTPAARAAMIAALRAHAGAPELSPLVTPRHAVTDAGHAASCGLRALNDVVATLDAEGKGVPVLLRQYLKLQARAVAFSVDPAFGHVVDALMVVDLARAPESMLRRYMGMDAAQVYLAHHAAACIAAAPVGACA